ncbi:MAG TPA: penicillin-binding protein 2 [Candidatus Eremiobacteraceae bacterium]|nr:penicillin-binding protein 2 [Candidatus Eremiobacteraceae bacterium]
MVAPLMQGLWGHSGSEESGERAQLPRLLVFVGGVAIVIGVLVWRLADVQLVHGAAYETLADQNQLRTIPLTAPRGVMYDRRGVVIVANRPSFVVQVVPMQVADPSSEIDELAGILHVTPQSLWKRLLRYNGVTYPSFDALAGAVPLGPITIAGDLNPATVARFSERADRLAGMAVELVPVRHYPYGTIGSHILGYVGRITQDEYEARKPLGYGPSDTIGKEGLEFTYDQAMRGESGGRAIKVNSAGQAVATLGEREAVPGNSLDLTVDWRLQRAAEAAMDRQIRVIASRIGHRVAGAAIVEDVNSGAILALVSQPNVNPNDFALPITEARYNEYLNDPLKPLFTRAIAGKYPTGSTFKMITSSAALASGVLTVDSVRYCPGYFDLGVVFNDDAAGGHGALTIRDAIARSCDVFFYKVGFELGITRLDRFASAYGVGSVTGIDLPGETSGTLPTPQWKKKVYDDQWYAGDTVNMAIGQGYVEVSPIQLLRVATAVANGGTLYRPFLLSDIRDAHGHVTRTEPYVEGHVPVPAGDLDLVRQGMLGAIESPYGTAHNIVIPGFHFAGKTGTVENVRTLDNPEGRNHAWFVCFAPYDHPQIAVVVFMEKSGGFGAVNAAPVAQAIVEYYYHLSREGPAGNGIHD